MIALSSSPILIIGKPLLDKRLTIIIHLWHFCSYDPMIWGCDRALKDSQGEKITQSGVSPTEDVWVKINHAIDPKKRNSYEELLP